MKIFLTGGNGMVGRNIAEHAAARAHALIAPNSQELDLTDRRATEAFVANTAPDLIVHAAGRVGGIQANIARPVDFLVDNLDIGRNVIMAARTAGVPRLLNLGSSCMYPRDAPNPLKEEALLSGVPETTNEGYALAKIVVARLCAYICSTAPGLQYKTLIPCNIYGIHDKFDPAVSHLVPAVIRKVHRAKVAGDKTVEIWGTGKARREFMFGGDLADGIWTAIGRFEDLPRLMNLGIGRDHPVEHYYRTAATVIGWDGEFVCDPSKPEGVRRKLVSVERQAAFGWMPATPLEEGIRLTYQHFLARYGDTGGADGMSEPGVDRGQRI